MPQALPRKCHIMIENHCRCAVCRFFPSVTSTGHHCALPESNMFTLLEWLKFASVESTPKSPKLHVKFIHNLSVFSLLVLKSLRNLACVSLQTEAEFALLRGVHCRTPVALVHGTLSLFRTQSRPNAAMCAVFSCIAVSKPVSRDI